MRIPKKFYIGAASLLVAAGAFVTLLSVTGGSAEALTMGDRRDCGYTDVIINCGATTSAELLQKYDSNDDGRGNRDIQAIFNHFGIRRSDITGATSDVKKGWLNTNGSISVDGVTVATSAKSLYRVDPGKQVSPITIAGKTYYIGPVANNYHLGADVFVFFNKDGTFRAAIQSSCGNPIVATPTPPAPKPVYKCEGLTATRIKDTREYSFKATASATNGAEIVDYTYNFGDGKSASGSNSINHTFTDAGTYTITVTVNVKIKATGEMVQTTGPNCKTTITIEEIPKTPIYKCESLTAQPILNKERAYAYTLSYVAENGASLTKVTYNFGDNKSQTLSSGDLTTIEHQFAESGNYKTTATLYFSVKEGNKTVEKTATCEVAISIPKKDYCPLPGKEQYPKDSPECQPCPTNPKLPKDSPECKVCPYNPELPYDSDKCVETPPELPKTGLDMFIGGGLGLGSITAASYYWIGSRKNLMNTFLKK